MYHKYYKIAKNSNTGKQVLALAQQLDNLAEKVRIFCKDYGIEEYQGNDYCVHFVEYMKCSNERLWAGYEWGKRYAPRKIRPKYNEDFDEWIELRKRWDRLHDEWGKCYAHVLWNCDHDFFHWGDAVLSHKEYILFSYWRDFAFSSDCIEITKSERDELIDSKIYLQECIAPCEWGICQSISLEDQYNKLI